LSICSSPGIGSAHTKFVCDLETILLQGHILVGPLTAQPESQGPNLRTAQVDVNAMKVVRKNQTGGSLPQVGQRWVVLLERRAKVGVIVGFLVNRE
jgi:hypothetical protein